MSNSEQTITLLVDTPSSPTMIDHLVQTTPFTKSDVSEEREVVPWTEDEERVIDEANKTMDSYIHKQNRNKE